MKRVIATICSIAVLVPVFAQNNLGKADDMARLALAPYIASNTSVPDFAQSLLRAKLQQVVTMNGLGSVSFDERFVITANLVEVYKEISTSNPTIYSVKLYTTFYIGDLATGTLFSSCPIGEIKGAGKSDTQAYMNAIKHISVDNPYVHQCIEEGKTKIIEYYNTQIDFIISKAIALADEDEYDCAIAMLMDVPEICKDAYEKAMNAVGVLYQRKINAESAAALAEATAIWSATQSYDGALEAASYLSRVHPQSNSAAGAKNLNEIIAARVKAIDNREWNYTVQQQKYDYNVRLEGVKAAKEIGVALAKRPVYYNTIVRWW